MVAEWELPADMSLGLMPGIISQTNAAGVRYTSAIAGAVPGKAWTDKFRTFVELAAPQIARARNGGTIATVNVGAACVLSDTCELDTAFSRGINKRTADTSWTVGLSFKL
jgi:hypothetical protein